jgi:hypothetical protein
MAKAMVKDLALDQVSTATTTTTTDVINRPVKNEFSQKISVR